MPITAANPFKWRHYPGDIILWCVRWYLRYPLSVAQMSEMAVERGLFISPSCVWRWAQVYSIPPVSSGARKQSRSLSLLKATRTRLRSMGSSYGTEGRQERYTNRDLMVGHQLKMNFIQWC